MNISLNISGQCFEVQKNTLIKIPYFHDMFDACGDDINEIIPVNRSPHIFKHVLALVIDPLYLFPAKYAFELDFYGVVYEKKNLYDKHQEIINRIDKIENNLDTLNNQVSNIKSKIKKVKTSIQYLPSDNSCHDFHCNYPHEEGSLFCAEHKKCLETNCFRYPNSGYNYCPEHYLSGYICDQGGCRHPREGTEYCQRHEK